MIICYYSIFVALCWLKIAYDLKNACMDEEQ